MAVHSIAYVGGKLRILIEFNRFFANIVVKCFSPPFRFRDIMRHTHFVANESMSIVLISVGFAASVTLIESSYHMKLVVQSDAMVPGFASLLILRELASIVTCLLLASRIGAGWTAEIGSMKVTEQIDAIQLMGIDPVKYLVVPRFIAAVFGSMILCGLAAVICLLMTMIISMVQLGYTGGSFIFLMNRFVSFDDFMLTVVKGLFFGAVIPAVSCFNGFRCKTGSEEVGMATTRSLVYITVGIILLDFIINWVYSFIN